jgi:dynein assembly factor 1
MEHAVWQNLEEVYLSRNMLVNIDVLNVFPNLKKIDASNNYIKEINLVSLRKLKDLNLQNNFIDKFPNIEKSKDLKILNMNSNKL